MSTPTAPLNPAAAAALARLERAFVPVSLDVARAVTRYEVATARYDELSARPVSTLSPAEATAFGDAQKTIDEALAELGKAGRLDLVGPARTASRYRKAAARVVELSTLALRDRMTGLDADDLVHAEDLMAAEKATLTAAGRLDLIEAS
ncbi:hypothetical protein [Streptomyces sp. STCH 565 A]|uniref:hypothetical protein n=1 Tax=Streptomyces sp. STCH 565 A TaxID=2950532 RepID=UPI002075B5AB|nr:hypothetical protein [Streptomyces sp. STCH 565 A]MCM8552277.1 hypothetical protein [Streptomyces sp. STCH 565 A]